MNNKNKDILNLYVQGSVWNWVKDDNIEKKPGVQSNGRPVLIVSNNTFNQWSPSVNCLTITRTIRNNPVHVPVTIDAFSHIQCEQIHTISKNELSGYRGMISSSTLYNVKAKMNIQFDMNTDRSLELLNGMKRGLDELNAKVDNFFETPVPASEMTRILTDIQGYLQGVTQDSPKTGARLLPEHPDNAQNTQAAGAAASLGEPQKKSRRTYSEEDISFILDEENPLSALVERFGFKDRHIASNMRTYFKNKSGAKRKTQESAPGSRRKAYTDEDKQFIADRSNSLQDLVDRFGYKNKSTASKMRSYYRLKIAE